MKKLLQEIRGIAAKRKEKRLTDKVCANLQKRYRNILTRGNKQLPSIPPKPEGKRGKTAKSDAHNLLERLQKEGPDSGKSHRGSHKEGDVPDGAVN